eukprot:Tbor_TRINITY_DN5215_c0_g1::TRINITY_DN5215_c0_g1_i1::g.16829::m.16829
MNPYAPFQLISAPLKENGWIIDELLVPIDVTPSTSWGLVRSEIGQELHSKFAVLKPTLKFPDINVENIPMWDQIIVGQDWLRSSCEITHSEHDGMGEYLNDIAENLLGVKDAEWTQLKATSTTKMTYFVTRSYTSAPLKEEKSLKNWSVAVFILHIGYSRLMLTLGIEERGSPSQESDVRWCAVLDFISRQLTEISSDPASEKATEDVFPFLACDIIGSSTSILLPLMKRKLGQLCSIRIRSFDPSYIALTTDGALESVQRCDITVCECDVSVADISRNTSLVSSDAMVTESAPARVDGTRHVVWGKSPVIAIEENRDRGIVEAALMEKFGLVDLHLESTNSADFSNIVRSISREFNSAFDTLKKHADIDNHVQQFSEICKNLINNYHLRWNLNVDFATSPKVVHYYPPRLSAQYGTLVLTDQSDMMLHCCPVRSSRRKERCDNGKEHMYCHNNNRSRLVIWLPRRDLRQAPCGDMFDARKYVPIRLPGNTVEVLFINKSNTREEENIWIELGIRSSPAPKPNQVSVEKTVVIQYQRIRDARSVSEYLDYLVMMNAAPTSNSTFSFASDNIAMSYFTVSEIIQSQGYLWLSSSQRPSLYHLHWWVRPSVCGAVGVLEIWTSLLTTDERGDGKGSYFRDVEAAVLSMDS